MRTFLAVLFLFFGISVLSAQCVTGDCTNGYGIHKYPSGNRYVGTWKEGKRDNGDFYYANGDHYSGYFKDNEKHGAGVYRYASGNRFEGVYSQGKKVEGTFYYINGNRYVGQYHDDKRNGRGTMYQADGKEFSGYWVDDKLNDQPAIDAGSGQTYVVMVGVSDYAVINDLNFCDDDALAMRRFFMSEDGGSIPAGNITLLLDDEATRSNILQAMRQQYAKANPQDNIIFFFSGHGDVGLFCPYDMDEDTALEHEEIKKAFRNSRAKNKVCMADACFSGSINSKGSEGASVATILMQMEEAQKDGTGMPDNAKVAVFMSSRRDEYSLELGGLKQGAFSYFLVEGLRGLADANHDRQITYGELFRYVNASVAEYTDGEQNPVLSCNDCQDTPLVRLK